MLSLTTEGQQTLVEIERTRRNELQLLNVGLFRQSVVRAINSELKSRVRCGTEY